MPRTIDVIISDAVAAVLGGDEAGARRELQSLPLSDLIDQYQTGRRVWRRGGIGVNKKSATPKPKRGAILEARKLIVFRRDAFTCRYRHCQRRTIYLPVLKALSARFPELLPCKLAWAPTNDHLVYLLYSSSLEHVVPLAQGGVDSEENWVTACYGCNDQKRHLELGDLGWALTPPADSAWDGLSSLLPQLERHLAKQ